MTQQQLETRNEALATGFFSRFTPEQMKAQYKANYESLTQMLDKAIRTGKKVGNYTEAQLRKSVAQYKALAGL